MTKLTIENKLNAKFRIIINDDQEFILTNNGNYSMDFPNNVTKVRVKNLFFSKKIYLKNESENENHLVVIEGRSRLSKVLILGIGCLLFCFSLKDKLQKQLSFLTIFLSIAAIFSLFTVLFDFKLQSFSSKSENLNFL